GTICEAPATAWNGTAVEVTTRPTSGPSAGASATSSPGPVHAAGGSSTSRGTGTPILTIPSHPRRTSKRSSRGSDPDAPAGVRSAHPAQSTARAWPNGHALARLPKLGSFLALLDVTRFRTLNAGPAGIGRLGRWGGLGRLRRPAVSLGRRRSLPVVGDVPPGALEDQRRRGKDPADPGAATLAPVHGPAHRVHRLELVLAACAPVFIGRHTRAHLPPTHTPAPPAARAGPASADLSIVAPTRGSCQATPARGVSRRCTCRRPGCGRRDRSRRVRGPPPPGPAARPTPAGPL